MKISINLLTNVLLLLVGILLIVFASHTDVLRWLAIAIGAVFLLPSLAYLARVAHRQSTAPHTIDLLSVVPAVGGLCFGLVMIIKPALFVGVISMLLGMLLVALGLFHIIYLLLSKRVLDVKGWLFVAPLLLVTAGAVILFWDEIRASGAKVSYITGTGLLLFAATSALEYHTERRQRAAARNAAEPEPAEPEPAEEPAEPAEEPAEEPVTKPAAEPEPDEPDTFYPNKTYE